MSRKERITHKTLALCMVAAALLALGLVILNLQPATTSDLAGYYPQNTSVYIELKTSPEKARQLFPIFEKTVLASQENAPKNNHNAKTKDMPKETGASKEKSGLEQSLVSHFKDAFTPNISLGAWMPGAHGQMTDPRMNVLVALPLQSKLTLPQVIRKLGLAPDDFQPVKLRGIPYAIHHESQMAIAVVHQVLLVGNTVDALIATIEQLPQNAVSKGPDPATSLLRRTHNRRYLSLLPRRKDGFFLIDHTALSRELSASQPHKLTSGATLLKVLPVTLGAVHLSDKASLINLETFTPLVLKNLNTLKLADPLRHLYATAGPMKTPQLLPKNTSFFIALTAADQLYDLLTNRLLSKAQQNQIQSAEKFLNMFNLNLRKDVIGLMQGEVSLAAPSATEKNVIPTILIARSEEKEKTLSRIADILGSGLIPVKRKTAAIDDVTVNTFSLPGKPVQLSVGNLGSMIAISAGPNFTQLVTTAHHPKTSLENDALLKTLKQHTPPKQLMMMYATVDTSDAELHTQLKANSQNAAAARLTSGDWLDALAGSLWARRVSQNEDLILGRLVLRLKTTP